jgi:hypothetical protein
MPELRDDGARRVIAAQRAEGEAARAALAGATVACFACCGAPKSGGHEPGCEADIRRRARSGRFD